MLGRGIFYHQTVLESLLGTGGGVEGVFVDDPIQPWCGSPLVMMEGADQMHVVLF